MSGADHGHGEHPVGTFIMAMIVIFVMSIVFGFTPIVWKKFRLSPYALSVANTFSAGLFMTLGLMLFLPEANHMFNTKMAHEEEHHDDHSGEEEEKEAE